MDLKNKARRSTLRNSDSTSNPRIEPNAVSTSKPKRRISFSGRKSVREFHAEEKPKSWNNSYEISDHLNSLENISTGSFGGDNFIPCHTQYKLPDCKENYSFSKNKRLINGRPLSENQNNVALAFEMETKNHDGEHGAFSYKFAKDNNMIVEIFCGEEKCKEIIESKSAEAITYYGNDDISVDHNSSNAKRKKLSLLQSTEMDITKYEDCVGDKKNASVEKKIEHGVQEITPSFSSKLPAITSERTIEAERVRFNNIAMPMDISIHIDDSFNCAGLLKITACSNSLNNSSVPESNNDEDLFKHEQSKNNSLVKKTYNPKIVPLKHATLKYDYRCLNVTSFTNVGLNVDFNSSQCNLSSSMSYNSPLFPPVKCKKLNLRQLNAEIGDGKIVVFPNKNVDNVEVGACLVSNKNVGFKPNNNEIREEKNISNLGKSQINNSSAELKPSEISEFDVSKHENSFMLADSASFFVKAKVLDSIMKINDKYRRDTIHFNSEMHTFSPTVTHVNPTIIESEVECVTKNVNNITLFNSSLTSNHSSMQTDDLSPIELTPCQQNVDKCDSVGRTIYEIVDMSLNNTDKEISAIISPKRIEPEIFVINDNSSYGRKTIYFDQEIDSLSATKIEYSHNTQEKVENMIHELKFTLHRKPMIVSKKILRRQIGAEIFNSSSDSFIVNLQEAKAALSSHRKPIIEGTPHRSFLEFEDLEREFEQDQLVCETNAKASVQQHPKLKLFDACRNEIRCNEANHSLIQNEIIRGKSQNQFKEKENEPDEKRFENIESHQNNETGNLDESGLKPIISAVIENTLLLSPIFNSVTNKRPTANLTPSLPSPKKRHTLLFNDCGTDESKILSANMTLRIRSCNEDAEVRNILGESKCRDALLEDRKFSTPNECIDPADGGIHSNLDAVKQTQNVEDNLHMNSFHSQIPIITQSNEINSTPTGLVETSAHTTQLSRHALICFETRPSTIKLPSEVHDTSNKLTCEIEDYDNFKYIFKDNAITISDVSVHYVQTSKIGDKIQNDFPLECLADSTKTAVFNNEFINLEREISPWSISEMEDIEKTRLSLVETLLSESDDAEEGAKQNLKEPEKELSDNISSQHNPGESCLASLRKESNIDVHENVNNKEFCRQCKNCQGVLTCESVLSASESFALPTMTPFAPIGFECLAKLRKRPKLKHIHAYWRRRSLEKKEDNLSTFVEQGAELDEEQNRDFYNRCHRKDFESRIEFLKRIDKQIKDLKIFEPLQTDIVFKNLNGMLRKVLPNWVLNSQMAARGIIQLRHTNFISFAIEILYEDRSQLGNPIFIKDISLQSGRIPSVLWKPIDHLLNFTLKMSLPLDLKSLCKFDTSANFVLGLLQHVDKVCTQALEDGINLWRLLINERANLTRDASRLIVRKITSEVVHKGADYYPFVNRTEFQIELTNIHTLSFRDIIFPPLHAFCEELQVLPSGIDFLKVFLKSPSTYLRS